MDRLIAAQIAGFTDYRTDESSDHPLTADERALAIEVGYEIAARHGLDLATYVAAQDEAEAQA